MTEPESILATLRELEEIDKRAAEQRAESNKLAAAVLDAIVRIARGEFDQKEISQ